MSSMYEDIIEFHRTFKLRGSRKPKELPEDKMHFRYKFMEEELAEYWNAWYNSDLEGQLDALVDLVYVAMGTSYMQGFDFEEAWRRVHAANMKKVRTKVASDSKRGSKFDVIKPKGWKAPDLKDLVK